MTLKKYFYSVLAVAGFATLAACSADEGTDPGSDSAPAVTLYTYAPGSGYNADEDLMIRIAPNNKVADIYYKSELTSAVQEYIAANGMDAYAEQVVASGTKLDGNTTQDIILTGLLGNYGRCRKRQENRCLNDVSGLDLDLHRLWYDHLRNPRTDGTEACSGHIGEVRCR